MAETYEMSANIKKHKRISQKIYYSKTLISSIKKLVETFTDSI